MASLIELDDGTILTETPAERFLREHPPASPGAKAQVHVRPYEREGRPVTGYVRDGEEGWNTQRLFHVTTAAKVNRILQQGLIPQEQGAESRTPFKIDPTAVYLWPSRKSAEAWIDYRRTRYPDENVKHRILKVTGFEPLRTGPDPEPFSELLRWFDYGPDFKPSSSFPADVYLHEALDKVGYYRDAVGGPEFVTLRQWLDEQPDKNQWVFTARTPTEATPAWFDETAPWAGATRLLHRMPPMLRANLADYTSQNPEGVYDSVVHYGSIPPEALST